ncbi:ATP-binding protein, partial [Lactobacillus crispatus]
MMQGLEGIAIKTEKADQVWPIHKTQMVLDRKGKPFCIECMKEQTEKEKNDQVKRFMHDKVTKILRTRSLVDRPEDLEKSLENYTAKKGSQEASMGNA